MLNHRTPSSRTVLGALAAALVSVGLAPAPAGASIPGTGELRVTTNPAVASVISVDGVARDTWGLTWLDIEPGSHEVCFSDVSGYRTPSCQSVDVTAGATTAVQGSFARQASLQVTTQPALPATITARDLTLGGTAVPLDNWGVFTWITASHAYEVCFGPVAGHLAPPCQTVLASQTGAGAAVSLTGTYSPSAQAPGPTGVGSLRVTTSPAVPAVVSVDGIPRDAWGLDWLAIEPGAHEVCFSDITGLGTPDCTEAVVSAGETTSVVGTYEVLGWLRASTNPPQDATVQVDGISRNDWGAWFPLPAGTHEVCFVVAGLAQRCHLADVAANATVEVTETQVSPVGVLGVGMSNPVLSGDGKYGAAIAFDSTFVTTGVITWEVLANGQQGSTSLLPTGFSPITDAPTISADGRYIVYGAADGPAVPGDDNGFDDLFRWDRQSNAVVRISTDAGDLGDASISSTGRFVTFTTDTDVKVWDAQTSTISSASDGGFVGGREPRISADGRHVVYLSDIGLVPEDDNGAPDLYQYDRQTADLSSISLDRFPFGPPGPSAARPLSFDMSGDGSSIAVEAIPPPREPGYIESSQIWIGARAGSSSFTQLTQSDDGFRAPVLSDDGSQLIYLTNEPGGGDPSLVVHGRWRVNGGPFFGSGIEPPADIADTGLVALSSLLAFVPSDTNGLADVYLF